MRRKALYGMVLVVFFLPGAAQAQAQSRKLSLDLYLELEDVADPQISPDGKQIVFTRRWVDKLNDKWESALWLMNADGSKQRDRKSTRLNSSHIQKSRMPSSA